MIWVQIPLNLEFFLLDMVYHSRETVNINLPAAHYDTNHVDRAQKSTDVMRIPVGKNYEKATDLLIKVDHTFGLIRNPLAK